MRRRLRGSSRSSQGDNAPSATNRTIVHGGWELLPVVQMVADGELFGGTWVVRSCSFGRPSPQGYEVRCLLGDNGHFATRGEAVRTAVLRAIRTIDLGEVGAVHLSPIPAGALGSGIA